MSTLNVEPGQPVRTPISTSQSLPDSGTSRLAYIDGLRAIAVGLVVWFHAQLPGLPNGYLGVDIFFVISGFLIPAQIIDQVGAKSFSIVDFYARRTLRIGPPLLIVVLCTLALTCVLPVLPHDMKRIAWSAVASLGLSANWYFVQGGGYFEIASEREPLLHLWSLAVEEQYYLVIPIGIVGLAYLTRHRPGRLDTWTSICTVATIVLSLGATMALARSKPMHAFYVTPLRAWEFAAGTAVFLAMRGGLTISGSLARAGVVAGLIAIAAGSAIPFTEPNPRLVLQILSVVGASAVLLCGAFALGGLGLTLLRARPVVGLGLISYSLYLWHWPLLSLWRITHLEPPTVTQRIFAGIAVPLIMAALTYVAVERPLRAWRSTGAIGRMRTRIVVSGIAASALLACGALGLAIWSGHLGYSERYRAYTEAAARIMETCPMGARGTGSVPTCRLGAGGPLRVLLLGDSHALSASGAVADSADALGLQAQLIWGGGCPPLGGNPIFVGPGVWKSCTDRNEDVLRLIKSSNDFSKVTGVVLTAAWERHLGRAAPPGPREEALRKLTEAMSVTLGRFRALGLRVLVIGPVPTMPYPVPECLFLSQPADISRCHLTGSDYHRTHDDVVAALKSATDRVSGVRWVEPAEAFCDHNACRVRTDHEIYYSDTHHLSAAGAQRLHDRFKDELNWVFSAPEREEPFPAETRPR